ncbi:protein of unknown function [Streptomyces sp. KY75]|nr:protein of unknown function [Streptomyces sp. KY75]CAD5986774.1 protein of unknown function [Streptomyces sp. KY70]
MPRSSAPIATRTVRRDCPSPGTMGGLSCWAMGVSSIRCDPLIHCTPLIHYTPILAVPPRYGLSGTGGALGFAGAGCIIAGSSRGGDPR